MPVFDIQCDSCKQVKEVYLSYNRLKENLDGSKFVCDCGSTQFHQTILTAPGMADPVTMGVRKLPSGWNDVLTRIKSASGKGANLDTSFSTKREH